MSPSYVPTPCTCISSAYNFNNTTGYCELSVSYCVNLSNSIGTTSSDSTSCICQSSYAWHAITATCELDCNQVYMANLTAVHPNGSCTCLERYEWVASNSNCTLNCSLVNDSNQTGLSTTGNCTCRTSSYVFTSNKTCNLSCSLVQKATNNTTAHIPIHCQC